MAMPLYTKVIKLDQDGFANPVQTTITVPGVETKNAAKLTGDVNGGGTVNIFDLVISAGSFGRTRAGIMGDVNGDGGVNIFDLVIVAGNFGKSLTAAPSTISKIELTTEQKHILPLLSTNWYLCLNAHQPKKWCWMFCKPFCRRDYPPALSC